MNYIRVTPQGSIYPYNKESAKLDFPGVSFPRPVPDAVLARYGIFPVEEVAQPAFDPATHKVVEAAPVEVSGAWQQSWSVVPLSQAELDAIAEIEREQAAMLAIKNDAQVRGLLRATPDRIDSYIEDNVNNLAQAKEVLKALARALSVVSQGILRG